VTVEAVAVRRGLYADSVTLMQISQQLTRADGIEAALVAMATELNTDLLITMGFASPDTESANDLLIAIRASDDAALKAATALAQQLLTTPRELPTGSGPVEQRPCTTASAARHGASLALISVPGQHAFTEAVDALEAGCDVLIFSDNVSVEHEIVLKDMAAERALLVMGPDCGTAVVGGVGLGFAHTVDHGPVGLVAASGTGAQQVLCLLDAAGVGVSAALGVGGRDLSDAVAGRSTLAALRILDDDPATELILVLSKPSADTVATQLRATAAGLRTPVHFALLGQGQPDLTMATEQVLTALGVAHDPWPSWLAPTAPRPGALRGLFCGGTLCDEAMLIASAELGAIRSNIPLEPAWRLDPSEQYPSAQSDSHSMIDFGDDALTQGRAHPMIDPALRNQHLQSTLADPATGVVLIDVLLGHGSHADPVADVVPLIRTATVPVVISLIGARRDPQDLTSSALRLHEAGASVFASNAAAARFAVSLIEHDSSMAEGRS
jgi:FdrA protein